MRVEVHLHATLAAYLPPSSDRGLALVDLEPDATVGALMARLAIPPELSRIVLVNGHDVEDDVRLHPGDVVDVFPPLAGGGRSPDGTLGKLARKRWDSGSV